MKSVATRSARLASDLPFSVGDATRLLRQQTYLQIPLRSLLLLISSLVVALASIYLGALFQLQQNNVALKMSSTAVETDKMAALATAADESRGLAMDSIAAAHSGHMGLPLGAAEVGAVLYGSQVRFKLLKFSTVV